MANINRVTITGNLTADPELRAAGGTQVCQLRVAVNHRRRNDETGEWFEEPNYFNVSVFGAQAESCNSYLYKGRPVAIDGRLRWREWTDQGGNKRQTVEIVAQQVQFLGSRGDRNGQSGQRPDNGFAQSSDVPADTSDFGEPAPVGAGDSPSGEGGGGGSDDDIPF
jgi:single-strand DNA-binding protein